MIGRTTPGSAVPVPLQGRPVARHVVFVGVARDSIFGWARPVGVNGLVRVGVPLASVRAVARRQVNRWATVALNAPWLALTAAMVVVAHELQGKGLGLPIQDAP